MKKLLITLILLLFLTPMLHSEIYKWQDSFGAWHFSDSPPQNIVTKEIGEVKSNNYNSSAKTSNNTSTPSHELVLQSCSYKFDESLMTKKAKEERIYIDYTIFNSYHKAIRAIDAKINFLDEYGAVLVTADISSNRSIKASSNFSNLTPYRCDKSLAALMRQVTPSYFTIKLKVYSITFHDNSKIYVRND